MQNTATKPTTPPDEVRRAPLLTQVQIPPPLGNPDGGRTERAAQPVQKPEPRQPAPDQVTAPPAIPDDLPQLEAPGVGPTTEGTGPGDGSVPGPIGVPWVVEGGFGPLDGPPVTAAVPEVKDRIYEVNEVVAPRIGGRQLLQHEMRGSCTASILHIRV